MWLIPLIALGAIFYLASGSPRAQAARYALPPPPPMPMFPPPVVVPPTPMDVLVLCVRHGKQPPPLVIMCAIAQVESIGRPDLASGIIRVFVEPVVNAHRQQQQRMSPCPGIVPPGVIPSMSSTPGSGLSVQATDAQIQAMLNSDPAAFANRMARGDVIDVDPGPEPEPMAPPQAMPQQHEPSDEQSQGATMVGSMPQLPSPIRGVDHVDWSNFCSKLAREDVAFVSNRHVGQYRQHKDRLAELGIDPSTLLGSPDAQRRALDRDLADAHHHAVAGGLATEHVGKRIAIPGHAEQLDVTLSGVLGVIQAAGLEGAADWLDRYDDRRRYKHTTQAFLRTNGTF